MKHKTGKKLLAPKRKRGRKHIVAVVVSCIHLPYVLKPAWDLFLQGVEIINPDVFVLNGDGADFAGIHPASKDKVAEVRFKEDELVPTRAYLDDLEAVIPTRADKIWIEGNHEDFWQKYYADKPAAPAKTWHEALGVSRTWDVREHDDKEMPAMMLGDLTVTHGTRVRAHSGWTAKAELLDRWSPVLIGHTHRMGSFFFTPAETGIIYDGYEIGCLADQTTARKYMKKKPNWQPGFAVVSFDESGWFEVTLKKISRIKDSPTYRLGLHEGILTAV